MLYEKLSPQSKKVVDEFATRLRPMTWTQRTDLLTAAAPHVAEALERVRPDQRYECSPRHQEAEQLDAILTIWWEEISNPEFPPIVLFHHALTVTLRKFHNCQ